MQMVIFFFLEIHKHVSCCPMFLIISILQPIKRALDKRTVEVYTLFNDELNAVKKELTSKGSPLPFNHPKFAGNAQWCRLLKKRIEREMMILDRAHFLPHMGEKFFYGCLYTKLCSHDHRMRIEKFKILQQKKTTICSQLRLIF